MKASTNGILLIDTSEGRCTTAEKLLGSGYSVHFSRNGEEALHLALTGNYDVILFEHFLPNINGLELVRRLRVADIQTPVMFLSELDSSSDKVEGLQAGADDYQSKSISFDELLSRIEALTRRQVTPGEATARRHDSSK